MSSRGNAVSGRGRSGARERLRLEQPDGTIGHAEIEIGGSPISLLDLVDDVDSVFERALAAWAELVKPVRDQFYGDRSRTMKDPFGHMWTIATRIEDVGPEELRRRFEALTAPGGDA